MVRYASWPFTPVPLTLTLSLRELREREQRASRSGRTRCLDCLDCSPRRGRFTLSPRERAGVRGNKARFILVKGESLSALAKQPQHRLSLDKLAWLIEVVVSDRVRVDPQRVIDRRQNLRRVHGVFRRR